MVKKEARREEKEDPFIDEEAGPWGNAQVVQAGERTALPDDAGDGAWRMRAAEGGSAPGSRLWKKRRRRRPAPAENEPVVPEEPEKIAYTAPLTGLPVDKPASARPLAVMINNAPTARPQSGLSQADIVYEVLAEGGITRLIGIFQSRGTNEKSARSAASARI